MSAEVKVGDTVVSLVDHQIAVTKGKSYEVRGIYDNTGRIWFYGDGGYYGSLVPSEFELPPKGANLYTLDKSFGELDQITQWALKGAHVEGHEVEFSVTKDFWCTGGYNYSPNWESSVTYRLKSIPKATPLDEARGIIQLEGKGYSKDDLIEALVNLVEYIEETKDA